MDHSLPYLVNCSLMFTEEPLLRRPAAAKAAGFSAVEFWWPFATPVPSDREVDAFVAAVSEAGVALVGLNFFAGDLAGPDCGVLSIPGRSAQFRDNIDVAVINIGHEDLSRYKLVVVPGDYVMDQASADNIRTYVRNGGTVIMTAFSAKVDEHSQWFHTPVPGRLSDVFGMRTNEFYRSHNPLTGKLGDADIKTSINFYEVLEPSTAQVLGRFDNIDGKPPIATLNHFGKGQAIYVATPAQPSIMQPLYRSLYAQLGIQPGPKTPDGVYARTVNGRTLYVNASNGPRDVVIDGTKKGLLSGKTWTGTLHLDADGVDLLQ